MAKLSKDIAGLQKRMQHLVVAVEGKQQPVVAPSGPAQARVVYLCMGTSRALRLSATRRRASVSADLVDVLPVGVKDNVDVCAPFAGQLAGQAPHQNSHAIRYGEVVDTLRQRIREHGSTAKSSRFPSKCQSNGVRSGGLYAPRGHTSRTRGSLAGCWPAAGRSSSSCGLPTSSPAKGRQRRDSGVSRRSARSLFFSPSRTGGSSPAGRDAAGRWGGRRPPCLLSWNLRRSGPQLHRDLVDRIGQDFS